MKKIYLLGLIILSSIKLLSQELPYAWNLTNQPITPSGTATYTVTGSTLDNSGNIFVTGYFIGTCDFDPSAATANLVSNSAGASQDIFIAKYNGQGQLMGTPKKIGGTATETSGNIVFDNITGAIYVTGSFTGTSNFNPSGTNNLISAGGADAFIASYDGNGNYLGAYAIGGTGADAGSRVRIYNNDIFVTGTYAGTVDFDSGAGVSNLTAIGTSSDIFMARYTTSAALVWANTIGSTINDTPGNFRVANNSVYINTTIASTAIDFDPGPGTSSLSGVNGSADFAFAKYDFLNGNLVWARVIGGQGTDSGALNIIEGSDLYVGGYFDQTVDLDPGAGVATAIATSGADAFLCRINSNGDLVWSKTWSAPGFTSVSVEQVLSDNTLLVTGVFEGSIDLDPNGGVFNQTSLGLADGFFLRMNTAGNFMDGFSIGGTSADNIPGATSDGTAKIYLGAVYSTPIDLDPTADINGITTTPVGGPQYFASSYSFLATVPSAQPTGLGFNTITDNSLNYSFTSAGSAGYLVIRKSGSAPTGIPKDGVAYSPGNSLGDGYIVQSSASISGSDILLAANTNYFYKVFSFNGAGLSINYLPGIPLQGSTTTSSITYNRTSDSLALVSFYNSTGGASWTNKTNWLTANPINTWFGVSFVGSRVTALNLPLNNVSGPIPGTIGNLSAVQTIDLHGNSINGQVPSEIGNLGNLINLGLYTNQISGALPPELGNITGLLYFDISFNLLTGTLPSSFANFTAINFIGASSNKLTGTIDPIKNLTTLDEIHLFTNQFSGSIPTELGSMPGLIKLSLSDNKFTGTIPSVLGSLPSLQWLYLATNQLTGSIPTSLGGISTLTELGLGNNQLTGALPLELGSLSNLTYLNVCTNQLTGSVPTEIGNLANLTSLYLCNNKFTGVIPSSYSSLAVLANFAMDGNGFTDLPNLSGISSLTSLIVRNNNFTFEDLEPNISKLGAAVNYSPQSIFGTLTNQTIVVGQSLNLTFTVGGTSNSYQWKKAAANVGTNSNSFSIPTVVSADAGTYTLTVTNSVVTGLTLTSANQIVNVKAEGLFDWVNAGDLTADGYNNGNVTSNQFYGGIWGDINNDGFDDVYLGGFGGSTRNYFYLNNANGTFSRLPNSAYGFDINRASTFGDYDNDGFVDLYVPDYFASDSTDGVSAFYKNNRNNTFTKIASPGLSEPAASWGDYDNDGDLDVLAMPSTSNAVIYRNDGGSTFTTLTPFQSGNQWHVSWVDYDNDGDLDVFMPASNTNPAQRQLYKNDGSGNFTLQTSNLIMSDPGANMRNGAWADIDNDGDYDLYSMESSSSENSFFINNGTGNFTKQTSTTVLGELVRGGRGSTFLDYDNDGYLDLLTIQTNVTPIGWFLFRNNGNGTFTKQVSQNFKIGNALVGASVSDYNNDGFPDIFSASFGQDYNGLYKNKGNGNNWLQVKLKGKVSNRDAIGAKVSVKAGGFWRHSQVLTSNGFGNQNSLVQQFGLGASTVADSIKIQWPSGYKQVLAGVAGNQRTTIVEVNQDSLALVALYNSTNGSGWAVKTNWLTGPLNTWFGVTMTGGRVTAINLSNNKLAGPIPVAVANLTSLTTLNLSNNQLTGGVPVQFNNLDALLQLNLSNNSLTDLPVLTGMASITNFYVDNNLFTFEDIQPNVSIPGIIYCCQKQLPFGGTVPVVVGGSLNLSATIGGTGNVYQWKKFGANITGATSNTYTVASSTIADAGSYFLQITNPAAPNLTLQTTNFLVQIKSLTAAEDSGYKFLIKLGAEALGIPQIKPGGRVSIDNLGNYYFASGAAFQKVDPLGNLLHTVSTNNSDIAGSDIAIDGQNSIYVPGANYSTLKKYNSSGTLVFETPFYSGNRPFQAIDVDVDGSILTMDLTGGVGGRIRRFDSITGNLIGSISLTGTTPPIPVSFYNNVFDFDVDATGNIYVPDDTRIDKYSPTGVFISSVDVNILNSWGGVILQVANNGHLYAANWFIGNIYHFDATGNLLNSFGFENAGFSSLTISSSNELVAGTSNGLGILKFDLNGNFLGFGEPRNANGQFSGAASVANDSKGFRYVVDRYNNRIQKLTANGNWVSNIGSLGSGAGQFNRPGSIAIDKSNNLYVTDDNNNRVQKFNSSGTHLLTIGSAGAGNGQFTNPVAIVVSKTGDILVADKGNSRIQIFKTDGTFVSAFGAAGTGTGQFTNLRALAAEADGTILTADGQARLQRFTSQGTFISELNMYGPVTAIPHVAADVDGSLYIPTGGMVKKFDKNGGHITDIGLPSTSALADGEIRSVSVSSNIAGDTLWIADNTTTNRVSVFTANFRRATTSDSLALVDLYNSTNGASWTTKTNWLTGSVDTWYGVQMSGGKIRKLSLPGNLLDGPIPSSLATLDNLLSLKMNGNKISGTLTDWNVGSPLKVIDLSGNKLTQIGNLKATNLSLDSLAVQNNKLTFEDLEPNISTPFFTYSPQDSTGLAENVLRQLTEPVSFTNAVAGSSVQYQWKKNNIVIPTATTNTYTLPSVQFADDATYRLEATSTLVPGLIITSRNKLLRVSSLKRDSIALRALYDSASGSGWTNKSNWLSTSLSTGNWFGVTVSNNRVTQVNLPGNNLIGKVPPQFANLKEVTSVNLSLNKISTLSNLSSLPLITTLKVENNQLDFGDLEANVSIPGITYSPQDSVSNYQSVLRQLGQDQTFTSAISGTANSYQWKKNGVNIPITTTDLLLSNISFADDAIYSFVATNSIVTGLTLSSAKKILRVSSLERDEKALTKLFNDTNGPNWIRKDNWISTPLATGNWFGVTIANNRVTQVNLPQNNLKGAVTAIVADIQNLVSLNLSDNKITSLPDLTSYPSISTLNVSKNNLDFASLEKNAGISVINYANQADLGNPLDTLVQVGSPIKFKLLTGGTTNSYQWIRNGQPVSTATDSIFTLSAIARNNMGDYICEVTNSAVPGLKLKSTLQRAKAVANISGQLQINSTTPVAKGKMILLKINPVGIRYDTTQTKNLNVDGTFNLEKVVLDDYILLGQADTIDYRDYFPTYYNGSVFWEEADTIRLNENRTDLTYAVATLPTEVPKGVGELRGIFENETGGGRVEGRGRVSGASVTVRRQQNAGRPSRKMAEDEIVAFQYTNDEGEFAFEKLEEGFYLLNIQFPGVPMDRKSDVVTTIGPASKKQNIQQVTAVAIGGKIVVTRRVIVGVSEEEQASIQIYPNPVTTDLYIALLKGSGVGEMKMFDSTGKEILSQHLKEGTSAFDLSTLSRGVYILKIYRGKTEVSAARIAVQ